MPKFAANLSFMFTEWDFLDRFAAAADAGFDAIEYFLPYDYPAETLAAALQRNSLHQILFNLYPGDWENGERGLAAQPGREDDFAASVDQALTYAAALGTQRLHVMAGIGKIADTAAIATYRRNLTLACARAADQGVTLLIEPINGRDMPGYLLNDFDFAAGIVRDLGLSNLKLQFDIYHRQILRGDVLTGLKAMLPMIGHVQIAAVPARSEPGSGELDDFRILAALDELGYRGYVGLEYRPAAGTLAGLRWRGCFGARNPISIPSNIERL